MTQEEETTRTPNHCTSLREYFASGKTSPLPARKTHLHPSPERNLRHEDDSLRALSADLGRPAFEAYTFEIAPVLREIEILEKISANGPAPKNQNPSPPPVKTEITTEPHDLVLIIAP